MQWSLFSGELPLLQELSRLYNLNRDKIYPEIQHRPLEATTRRWDNAFCKSTLNLKENSITLAPWHLAIVGDYMNADLYATPVEAAAMSGLEAGERVAEFFPKESVYNKEEGSDDD